MNQKRMLIYIMALMGMMLVLSLSNNPYSGEVVEETPEAAIAMGLNTAEVPVTEEDITILASADKGKTKLYIFEKDGEEWVAYASGDVFSMRYDMLYQQLSEDANVYTLNDYTHQYQYEYVNGELQETGESFHVDDDIVFTLIEIAIIVAMLIGIRRKEKKKEK